MSKVYLDKDGHYTSWPVRWYQNKTVMNKLLSVLLASGLFLIVELLLYVVVSIGGKSFNFRKWDSGAGDMFSALSILFLFGYAVVTMLLLIGELKPKKQ